MLILTCTSIFLYPWGAFNWVDFSELSSWLLRWHPSGFSTDCSGWPTWVASAGFSSACPHMLEFLRSQPVWMGREVLVTLLPFCGPSHTICPNMDLSSWLQPKCQTASRHFHSCVLQKPQTYFEQKWDVELSLSNSAALSSQNRHLCLLNCDLISSSSLLPIVNPLHPVNSACKYIHIVRYPHSIKCKIPCCWYFLNFDRKWPWNVFHHATTSQLFHGW